MIKRKNATIREVAHLAGVAPSTVSRILNKKDLPIAVTDETRKRVLDAARALNYKANRLAAGLAVAHTHIIGLSLPSVIPDLDGAFPAVTYENRGALICGMLAYLHSRGYELHVLNRLENDAATPVSTRKPCVDFLDGIIYECPNPRFPQYTELMETGLPLVAIGASPVPESVPAVGPDDRAEVCELVKALHALGHRHIAYLLALETEPPFDVLNRIEGYRDAHELLGLPFDPRLINRDRVDVISVAAAMHRLLALEPRPTAVIVGRTEAAPDALEAIRKQELTCPGEVDLVVVGDDRAFDAVTPSLTALRIPYFQIGEEAARLMIDIVEGRPHAPCATVPMSLVLRDSCGLRTPVRQVRAPRKGAGTKRGARKRKEVHQLAEQS